MERVSLQFTPEEVEGLQSEDISIQEGVQKKICDRLGRVLFMTCRMLGCDEAAAAEAVALAFLGLFEDGVDEQIRTSDDAERLLIKHLCKALPNPSREMLRPGDEELDLIELLRARIIWVQFLISHCQQKLAPTEKEIFTMKFCDGLTWQQIACQLNITTDSVRVRLKRIEQFLKKTELVAAPLKNLN